MTTESGPRHQRYEGGEAVPESYTDLPADVPEMPTRPPEQHTADTLQEIADTAENRYTSPWRRRLMGLGAGVALTAVGVGVGMNMGSSNDKAPEKRPSASAPANPGESKPTPSAEETQSSDETKADFYPSIYESALYKELTPDQQNEVNKLDEMSYEVFSRLPYSRQIAYADFYFRANEEYGREQVERKSYYREVPESMSANSTGQEILDDFAARQGAIYYSLSEKGNPNSINETNRDEAKKALAYIYDLELKSDSGIYTKRISELSNLTSLEGDGSEYNGNGYPMRDADRESKTGKDLFGTTTKLINVIDAKGEADQYNFTYETFTDIQGKERSVWQMRMILGEDHTLYVPDVENAFK